MLILSIEDILNFRNFLILFVLIGSSLILFIFISALYIKYVDDSIMKLEKEIKVLKYLNSDIKEINTIVKRLEDEISLDLITRKWQLRQRFSDLVISYGYVPKLDLKIIKETKLIK